MRRPAGARASVTSLFPFASPACRRGRGAHAVAFDASARASALTSAAAAPLQGGMSHGAGLGLDGRRASSDCGCDCSA